MPCNHPEDHRFHKQHFIQNKTDIIRHVLKMQEISMLPKHIKFLGVFSCACSRPVLHIQHTFHLIITVVPGHHAKICNHSIHNFPESFLLRWLSVLTLSVIIISFLTTKHDWCTRIHACTHAHTQSLQ
jgi:hypothetical protein